MAKKSAIELSEDINGLEIDEDVKVRLMEDITDSVSSEDSEVITDLKSQVDEWKAKYEDARTKYKERFYTADTSTNEKIQEDSDSRELEEKEVIDIKEI